jgi:hypothetical protein
MSIITRMGSRTAFGGYSINGVCKLVDQCRPPTYKLTAGRQEMLTRLSWHPFDWAKCRASASVHQTLDEATRRLLKFVTVTLLGSSRLLLPILLPVCHAITPVSCPA